MLHRTATFFGQCGIAFCLASDLSLAAGKRNMIVARYIGAAGQPL